jgi:hypothetical protein
VPLDFALRDDEIHEVTQAMVHATPGSMERTQWRDRLRQRLAEEGTIEHRAAPPEHAGAPASGPV